MNNNFRLELKSISPNGIFSGYASIFNNSDSHGDIIKPGAFKQSLTKKNIHNIKLLWQHQPEMPIGKIIELKEDKVGLYLEAQLLTEVKQAYEALILLQNQAINGLSIGYQVQESYYDPLIKKRILSKIDLHEISLVTFPSNPQSVINSIKNYNSLNLKQALDRAIQILKSN